MKIISSKIPDVKILVPKKFNDKRGFFYESFNEKEFLEIIGKKIIFVQDNHSSSSRGVLRGLHFQKNKPQGKLVRVVRGEVFDVAVDLRQGSPTFGQWESIILSEKNKLQFWVPPGFAHGFVVISDIADFEYKCTDYYDPSDEGSLFWNDPHLNIPWPIDTPKLSEKDANAPLLADIKK